MLALALTVAGLVWARRWSAWPGLLGAVILFALAFLTKQSALVGPAAAGLWLLARGGPWRSFALVMAAFLVVPFGLLNLALGGGLWLHLVVFQQIPWFFGQVRHQFNKVIETYPWLLAAAALALGWLVWRRPRWPWSPPLCYLLAALPVTILINGRASVNYGLLLDLMAPLCLLVGLAAGAMSRATGWRLAPAAALSGLLLAQALIPNPPGEWYSQNRMPSDQRAERMENIAEMVEANEGLFLSEDIYILLRAGEEVEYDDTFMMARAAERGIWDEDRLIDDLEARRFTLILLEYDITNVPRTPRWSPEALEALQENYDLLYRDVLFVHQPEP